MRQIMDFMEKEEEKEGRKVNFPEIKKLLLVSENFEDHYDPSEIVNSMRT
jgi:hypothetical protein